MDAESVLLTNARVVDPARDYDAPGWVLLREARIAAIGGPGETPPEAGDTLNVEGRVVAPGFVDLGAHLDAGGETGDDLAQLSAAALRGGVTTLIISADSRPTPQTPEAVAALLQAPTSSPAPRRHVVAAATREDPDDGVLLAEMGLMREAGARAVGAGDRPIAHAGLTRAAMIYAKGMGLPMVSPARHAALEADAVAHDGPIAARLGLIGAPASAEAVAIARDAALARDADATLILTGVSTREGLRAARQAKADSAETGRGRIHIAAAAHNLMLNDVDLVSFDPAFRVTPPLREEEDRQALIAALADGTLDIIQSRHRAVPLASKQHAFPDAAPGAPALETLAAAALSLVHGGAATLAQALNRLTSGPADALGLPQGRLNLGAPADLVVLDINAPWACRAADFASTGRVTPLEGRLLTGRPTAAIVAGRVAWRSREATTVPAGG